MKLVISIIVFLVLAYIAIGLLLYWLQERVIFHPQVLEEDYQFEFDTEHGFEEIFLEAPDGSRLHALLFKNKEPLGVVIYFHGNAGSLAGWGSVAYDLIPYGYEVLIPDYRSYGKSTGQLSEANLYSDAQLWYDRCKDLFAEDRIIIYGRSLGTGIATQLAANNHPRSLALETPFSSAVDLAKRTFPGFPHKWLLKYPFENIVHLLSVTCPIFVIHGTSDEVVPYDSGQELVKAHATKDIRFWTVEGGHHNDLAAHPEYFDFLRALFTGG